jgi:hypothetical protein
MMDDLGPVYTKGKSYRARAEARQREYRGEVSRVGWTTWGHWLDATAAEAGANFVVSEAHQAALLRRDQGKGVAARTFNNMLASQAMCFNLFAPLAQDTDLAARILRGFVAELATVKRIQFEYTPPNDLFGDQSGHGGVDCDVLVEATWSDGTDAVVTIETKFVETEFSVCGFRKPGREKNGRAVCPGELVVEPDASNCLYVTRKGYRYWHWARRVRNLRAELLPGACPFGGPLWQLWVNHTLACAEASRRGARHAAFGVCAPAGNDALLKGGLVFDRFRSLLTQPSTFFFIPLDQLIDDIREACQAAGGRHRQWSNGIAARYAGI